MEVGVGVSGCCRSFKKITNTKQDDVFNVNISVCVWGGVRMFKYNQHDSLSPSPSFFSLSLSLSLSLNSILFLSLSLSLSLSHEYCRLEFQTADDTLSLSLSPRSIISLPLPFILFYVYFNF